MTELRLEGVSKRYGTGDGETIALENVNLSVRDGEFFTLVGPSGCGKTTTLRAIAGFETLTDGTVAFDGEAMTAVPPEDRDIGIVFQSYALFPHMSVAENVGYGLEFSDPPAGRTASERVVELLDLVDLGGMGDRSPDQLSGGQRQRVALARALAPEPDLLLLDEPMSALDAQLRESLRLQLKRIQSDLDITTIYVTHDQEEALAISDRLAVMSAGRIEQVGTPQEIYRKPATRFVAEFVGDNTVVDGRVLETGATSGIADESSGLADDSSRETGETSEGTSEANTTESRVAVGDATFELPPLPAGTETVSFCLRPGTLVRDAERNRFTVDVDTCEFLGERVRAHGRWNGTSIVLRLETMPPDSITVGFDPQDVHVLETS